MNWFSLKYFFPNKQKKDQPQKIEGYPFFHQKTGLDVFFEKNGNRYRTGFKINPRQKEDLESNGNMM